MAGVTGTAVGGTGVAVGCGAEVGATVGAGVGVAVGVGVVFIIDCLDFTEGGAGGGPYTEAPATPLFCLFKGKFKSL